jgi:hypothetical protein
MRSVRLALTFSAVWFGCSESAPAKLERGEPTEILLEATGELPRFRIHATFASGVDARPHIQPVAAALVAARGVCCPKDGPVKVGATAAVNLDVHDRTIHAESKNPTGACFARELDGKPTDDAASFRVELLVSVG